MKGPGQRFSRRAAMLIRRARRVADAEATMCKARAALCIAVRHCHASDVAHSSLNLQEAQRQITRARRALRKVAAIDEQIGRQTTPSTPKPTPAPTHQPNH